MMHSFEYAKELVTEAVIRGDIICGLKFENQTRRGVLYSLQWCSGGKRSTG